MVLQLKQLIVPVTCSFRLRSTVQWRNHIFRSHSAMSFNHIPLVAVCQMKSTSDKEKNFEAVKGLINEAHAKGAKMVFLPECFDHIGESRKQSIELAEHLEGPLISKYREIASSKKLWLSLGGFHEKGPESDPDRIYNTHLIINEEGNIASVYRKIHLFDINYPGGVRLKESDYVIGGPKVSSPVSTPVGKLGLGICYDMRFPEFSLSLTKAGAEILTYPSAFTQTTGMAHWEVLLRTRAIENQCYVVAAAQTGKHNEKRVSYGHAMIVDPWGCVIVCCSEGTGIAVASLDLDYLQKIRTGMPVWLHRRPDIYGDILTPSAEESAVADSYMFGPHKLSASQIFYSTKSSMALVNRKPVLRGHVLVCPIRCTPRLKDLSALEVADLFTCAQNVQKAIEAEYGTSSSTIAIQDGTDAGQSVPHVHVHILPRKPGDFKQNDEVYVQLETHDKAEDPKFRSNEEMADEANTLRKYF